MIKVTSANNKNDFFINHRKIEIIKQIEKNLYIVLDTGKPYIVTNSIEDIKNKIIEFENSIIYVKKIEDNITEEVFEDE